MARWGILLDSGHIREIFGTRATARAAMKRQNDAHRSMKAEPGALVWPRRAIGMVHYKPKKSPAATAKRWKR
jgi:hypothetical protein